MPRIAGSKNKPKPEIEDLFVYTLEQRMQIITGLMVECILEKNRARAKS